MKKMTKAVLNRVQEVAEISLSDLRDEFLADQQEMNQIISTLIDDGKIRYVRYLRTVGPTNEKENPGDD